MVKILKSNIGTKKVFLLMKTIKIDKITNLRFPYQLVADEKSYWQEKLFTLVNHPTLGLICFSLINRTIFIACS